MLVAPIFCAVLAIGTTDAFVPGGLVATLASPCHQPQQPLAPTGSSATDTLHGQSDDPQSRLRYCNLLAKKEGMSDPTRKTFMAPV
jgi:hypothetical protein